MAKGGISARQKMLVSQIERVDRVLSDRKHANAKLEIAIIIVSLLALTGVLVYLKFALLGFLILGFVSLVVAGVLIAWSEWTSFFYHLLLGAALLLGGIGGLLEGSVFWGVVGLIFGFMIFYPSLAETSEFLFSTLKRVWITLKLKAERLRYHIAKWSPSVFIVHTDSDIPSVSLFSEISIECYRRGIRAIQYPDFEWTSYGWMPDKDLSNVTRQLRLTSTEGPPIPTLRGVKSVVVIQSPRAMGNNVRGELAVINHLRLPVHLVTLPGVCSRWRFSNRRSALEVENLNPLDCGQLRRIAETVADRVSRDLSIPGMSSQP